MTSPTAAQRARLERFLDEMELWNRRLNLTAIPRAAAWQRHVDESIGLLEDAEVAPGQRVVDIGSGGGVPGLVWAVLRPDLRLTLVEADRRKAGFLVHVSGLLELDNVTVVARRAEELAVDPNHAGRHDIAISRAAAPPPLLCRWAMPLLRDRGRLWALVRDGPAAAASVIESGLPEALVSAQAGVLSVLSPGGGALPPPRHARPTTG